MAAAASAASKSTSSASEIYLQLNQLRQLLLDFESVFALLNMYPELAKTRDPESNNMLPLHTAMMVGAPTTTVMILLEAYPDAVKCFDASGNTPFHTGIVPALEQVIVPTSSQIEAGRGKSPMADIVAILSNINFILDCFPEIVQQKDGTGNLPLNAFCSSFIPSLRHKIYLDVAEQREAAHVVTNTLEKIYRASPAASEIIGPSTGSPVSILVGDCAAAKSVEELLNRETILRLKILLQKARDGRALQTLFSLENTVSLWAFFSLFDENEIMKSHQHKSDKKEKFIPKIVLDLNKEVLSRWCLLDIVADFDTADAASALLQIIVEQKNKLDSDNQDFSITNEDGKIIFDFVSVTKLSNSVRTRVADRAKLSNSSTDLKRWGQGYGRFLRKYRLEKQPKHVSESCVVVFGTETIKENDGRMVEVPVALKFMSTREMFCNEVYQRREVEKRGKDDSKYIVPIKASFSSMNIDEFDCTKVNLATELVSYPNIKLEGSDLKYLIVMDCGGGYDLHDFISHQNIAGKDLLVVASIAKEIALCLKFLNEKCGVCHGDVKARNFVARGVGLVGFAAIDMDNSSLIGRETVGKKRTSTGYLPPEQAAVVAFERSNDAGRSLDLVDEPVESIMVQISAASSRNDSDEMKRLVQLCSKSLLLRETQSKPRDVIATSQYDMWCFGALLYFLCTGKQLFNVDMKEDVDDDDLVTLRNWDVTSKYEKLSKVDTKWPVSLLDSLLQKDPNDRPENWTVIVNELNRLGNTQDNYDRLFVFQSDPLVFKDKNNNIQPLPRVNFDQESHMLCEALKDAETVGCTIDVCFETASLDRINAFLAQGICQVMHFSGHGHQSYIALEDERGGLEMVDSDGLKRMVSVVDGRLLVVFISACHSQWVGEAFVDAGVPHAVCCVVDERLQDAAATEFTRNFYRALACRNSLLKAFNMAQQAVQNSPLVMNSEIEADKFLLLPEKPEDPSYHDVPVFFSSETLSIMDEFRNEVTTVGLQRYKDFLVGREVQQYSILNDISTTDAVLVYGKAGVGKEAIVSAVCDHISQRPRSYPFNYIFWYPSRGSVNSKCDLYQSISSFITSVVNESSENIGEGSRLQKLLQSITKMVVDKSVLLILDLRSYEIGKNKNCIGNLRRAVNDLFELPAVKCLKIILISEQISMGWSPTGGEKIVPVWELDLESAIILFAHNIPSSLRQRHPMLNSPDEFISYICNPSEHIQNNKDYERREEELWNRVFGGGLPRVCRNIARALSEKRAMEILDWWGTFEKDESQIPMEDLFL